MKQVNLAKKRRASALKSLAEDRVLVRPKADSSKSKSPNEGSAAAFLISALERGTTAQELAGETGWSTATVMVNLFWVVKKAGLGIQRRNNRLFLLQFDDSLGPRQLNEDRAKEAQPEAGTCAA